MNFAKSLPSIKAPSTAGFKAAKASAAPKFKAAGMPKISPGVVGKVEQNLVRGINSTGASQKSPVGTVASQHPSYKK